MEAARMTAGEDIMLDGRLDEPVWTRALPAKDFIQIDPQNGEPATEPTEVRIAFSEDAFYMGVTAYDSEPDKWLGFQRRRDEFLASDDRFMWRIDTFLDERSGLLLRDEPVGADGRRRLRRERHEPRLGRHLERARPPQRDRLDHRDRDSVPHAQLRSGQRHLGHQLPAHGPPEERGQHLDGLVAQPGPGAHDQCRARHRHPRGHARDMAWTSSHTASSAPTASPQTGRRMEPRWQRRRSTSSTIPRQVCAPT